MDDEIVDEVRAIRNAHAAKFHYDLVAICEDLKKSEALRIQNGHPFVPLPSGQPKPTSSLHRIRFARP